MDALWIGTPKKKESTPILAHAEPPPPNSGHLYEWHKDPLSTFSPHPNYATISAVHTHTTVTDFHNTSLSNHEYWEMQQDKAEALAIANLNTANCWQHDGFMDFYRAVCDSATKQAASPYGSFDYDDAFDDGTPLEVIIEAFQDGDSAAQTAEALLQGEAEQAVEEIVREGGIF